MRVVAVSPRSRVPGTRRASPAARLEVLGLSVATVVVLAGLALAYFGKTAATAHGESPEAFHVIDVTRLGGPDDLVPLLDMFDPPFERRAAAVALYRHATAIGAALDHVGALATATVPASEIRADRRYVQLRARLDRRPALTGVPVLSPADLAALKPRLVVRTLDAYRVRVASA